MTGPAVFSGLAGAGDCRAGKSRRETTDSQRAHSEVSSYKNSSMLRLIQKRKQHISFKFLVRVQHAFEVTVAALNTLAGSAEL